MDAIKSILNKIPFQAVAVLTLLYFGYEYWDFMNSPESPLLIKQTELKTAKDEVAKLEKKSEEVRQFMRLLESKKVELRQLSSELAEMQTAFNDFLDTPAFLQMLATEAKKMGMRLQGIKPQRGEKAEFVVSHHFDIEFSGVYAQVVGFMQRMSQVQNIVRIDTLEIKRVGSPDKHLVELRGVIRVTAFTYNRSLADEKAKEAAKAGGS